MQNQSELRICLDIGSVRHYVAIGLSTGERIDGFYLNHTSEDIEQFFEKIEKLRISYNMPVVMAMEGFNGYARPIDRYALDHGYSLYSVNNMKLARFKEVFPGPAKTDPIDAWAIFSLFQVQETLPLAKNILQKVEPPPVCNEQLKHISRRRRELVKEKTRIINRLQGDLQAVCPGLLSITKNPANLWFLRFLASKEDMTMLLRMQKRSLLQIKGVGEVYAEEIQKWQKTAKFSSKVEWIGKLIVRDVRRLLEMLDEIAQCTATAMMAPRRHAVGTFHHRPASASWHLPSPTDDNLLAPPPSPTRDTRLAPPITARRQSVGT